MAKIAIPAQEFSEKIGKIARILRADREKLIYTFS